LAPDGENIERAHRASGLAALVQMFAEPSGQAICVARRQGEAEQGRYDA
jgi:hypothetical protein